MIVAAVATAVILVLLVVLLFVWKKRLQKYAGFKYEEPIPFIGNALNLPSSPHGLMQYLIRLHEKLGPTYIVWLGFRPSMITCDLDLVERLLSSQLLIKKSFFYDFLHDWLGTGLLTSTGEKWKNRRRLITPTFHFAILDHFVSVFERQGKILVDKLNYFAERGLAFDIQPPVSRCALDIICETAMGIDFHAQEENDSEYISAVLALSGHIQMRQKNPFLWPELIYRLSPEGRKQQKSLNTVLRFTRKIITDRIEMRNRSGLRSEKSAFLDLLLDSYTKGDIDFEGIREEVDTFMFEGHDTTSAALSWTVFLLGHHPEIQAKLHSEIDGVVEGSSESIYEQVKSLKYLESVIKEALRLYPSVSFISRQIDEDTEINGIVIPTGTALSVSSYALHRSSKLWDDPDKFDPDRFLSGQFSKRHAYQYVPFSAGPRNCIGQKFALLEEKFVLYNVMKRFEVKSVQKFDEVELCAELITRSNNGLWVQLNKR